MSGSERESHQAGAEARRDVLGHSAQPASTSRYDALLRYLRGMWARGEDGNREPTGTQTKPEPEVERGQDDAAAKS